MNRLPSPHCLLCLLLLLIVAGSARAQQVPPGGTFFLRPHVGLAGYMGDRGQALLSFDGTVPYSAGVDLGYQFSSPLSLSAGYLLGSYPGILAADENELRHTGRLLLRYAFGNPTQVRPYLQVGAHATFGQNAAEENETAFGPAAGLGLSVPLSPRTTFFVEGTTHAAFPDEAVDGRDDESGSFDLLNSFSIGLQINFRSGIVPVRVLRVEGPSTLPAGQEGTFTAAVNEDRATRPVTYRWEFGDGTTAMGLTATHRYATPGTYTVRFTAANRGGTDAATHTVQVTEPPVPAAIVTLTADPASPDTQTPVRFRADVRGTAPVRYTWAFGDGATSTEAAPTHTYTEAGTYTVTLQVENAYGSDRRTTTVTVRPYLAEICYEIEEMNAAFFERNASVLTAEARRSLDENAAILTECPNLNVRLEGFAAPGERNPQRLSEDRARAVEAYYRERGIAASRMQTQGMGAPRGMTTKKEGASQYRRVDTIPLR